MYTNGTTKDVATRLLEKIAGEVEAGRRVLLLVPGGSAQMVFPDLFPALMPYAQSLTVSLTDERYGQPGHVDSNWNGVLPYLGELDARPVLENAPIEDTTKRYAERLWSAATDPSVSIIALFGMGADGHIAGITPHSPACESTEMAVYFTGDDYERITMTTALFPYVDYAVLYTAGAEKQTVLARLSDASDMAELPVLSLFQAKSYNIIYEGMKS